MTKQLLPLLLLLCCAQMALAQKTHWAIRDSGWYHFASDIALDSSGNAIVVGNVKGGTPGIYIVKYNKAGQKLWNISVNNHPFYDKAKNVAVDASGNIYVSGYFRGDSLDFDPSPAATAYLTSRGDTGYQNWWSGGDAFLAKYSPNGDYLWAFNVGGMSDRDMGAKLCIDKQGNILWTGTYGGTNVDFDPSPATHLLSSQGEVEPFIAKYTPGGQFISVVHFAGNMSDNNNAYYMTSVPQQRATTPAGIATDKSGNIYFSGVFAGKIDLNPGIDTNYYSTYSIWIPGSFVVKLDSNMQYQWGFALTGSTWGILARDMGIDSLGNVYVSGEFKGYNVDFDPGATVNAISSNGGQDAFVAKYDASGNYQFAHHIGSSNENSAMEISVTPSGDFTLAGYFTNGADFNPGTGNFVLTSGGSRDAFVARFSRDGAFQNAFKIGGASAEEAWCIASEYISPEGGSNPYHENIVVAGNFMGQNIDFDPAAPKLFLSSNYPSVEDIFVGKYSSLESVNMLHGTVFRDNNRNGIKDANEQFYLNDHAQIRCTKQNGDTIIKFSTLGGFTIPLDTGYYTTSASVAPPYYNAVPASHVTNFATYVNSDSISFALQPMRGMRDVIVSLTPLERLHPGMNGIYHIEYENVGTDTIPLGSIELALDLRHTFTSAIPWPSALGNTLRWDYFDLKPGDVGQIDVALMLDPLTMFNDTVINIATINPVASDLTPADNVSRNVKIISLAYDPNDKTESHGGHITLAQASSEYLQYTIRFQNTGNDTAFNTSILDTLADNLDRSSLQMLMSSHPYQFTMLEGKHCEWKFSNIRLVDSFANEALSHGYIVFRIKAKAGLNVGDVIRNSASIYFDYNGPVHTNTEITTVVANTLPLKLLTFTANKDGKANKLQWSTANQANVDRFEAERSPGGREFSKIATVSSEMTVVSVHNYSFTDNSPLPTNNYYRLKMIDKDGQFTYSPMRMISKSGAFSVSIYPNPAKDKLQVQIDSDKKTALQLLVVSLDGKVLLSKNVTTAEGSILRSINISSLQKGSYLLKVVSFNPPSADRKAQVMKFEKL